MTQPDFSSVKEIIHSVSVLSNLGVLTLLVKEHKIWTRLKDRVNNMWFEYCQNHDIQFEKVDE